MNFKTTALLLLAAVIIAAYFFLIDRKTPSTTELQETASDQAGADQGTPLFTSDQLSTAAVDHLTIDANATHTELARQGPDWQEVKPVRFPLDPWSAENVRDAAAGLRYTRKFTPGQRDMPKAQDTGLAPPDAVVTLTTAGPKPANFTVKVGHAIPGGRAYAMVDDKPDVYVVSDALRRAVVDQKPQDWRRHTLGSPHESRTDQIDFVRRTSLGAGASLSGQSTAPDTLELVRHDGTWALGGNDTGRVDTKKVEDFLNALGDMRIDRFVADAPTDLAEYGLDKPSLTLTIQSTLPPPTSFMKGVGATTAPATQAAKAKPVTQTLRIGGAVDIDGSAYFATWADGSAPGNVVFTILNADRQKLEKTARDFRDERLTTLTTADTSAVSVDQPGQKYELKRDDKGGWKFVPGTAGTATAPAGAEVGAGAGFTPDNDAVAEMIDSLVVLRAQGFVPNVKPTGPPLARITLTGRGRAEPDVITVFPAPTLPGAPAPAATSPDSARRMVLRNNEPTGLLVPAARLAMALAPVVTLRDRDVLRASPDQIKSIQIIRAGLPPEDREVTLTRQVVAPTSRPGAPTPVEAQTGVWRLGSGGKIDPASLDTLLAAIAPLHAETWTATEKPNPADAKSVIDAQVTTTSGKTLAVRIFPAARLGSVPGTEGYFRVERALPDILQAEFRDRTIVGIDVDDLTQVTVTDRKPGTADHVAVVKRTDLGAFECPTVKDLSQANAGQLFAALADLHAVRYVTPPAMPSPDAGRTLELLAKSGRSVHLFLPDGRGLEDTACTVLPDGTRHWFTLTDDAAKRLRADLKAPSKSV